MIITSIVIVAIIIGLIMLLQGPKEEPLPDISKSISPSQAYQVCGKNSCATEEVIIEGEMTSGFNINDGKNTVFTRFEQGTTMLDKIKAIEENELLGDGIVKVRASGKIHHELGMCTNIGCRDMVILTIKTEDIEFIEKVGCKGDNYKGGRWHPKLEDCFDYSVFELKSSEAYEKLMESGVLEEGGYETTNYYDYDFEENFWRFQLSGGAPGTQFAHVSLEEVVIV